MRPIFIDRDGVINKDPGGWTEHSYVTNREDFHFLPGAKEALRLLNDNGYDIIIISNQGGVSKKFFSESALNEVTGKMLDELKEAGVRIEKVYYCVHQDSDNCDCRKPKTGLFRQAEEELGITAKGHYFIGDGKMDVEAGRRAGLKTVLVLSGKASLEAIDAWETKPDHIVGDLMEAVEAIVKGEF
ncbi:MAG: HAD family hydrolase [Candidatus Omnitrophica bacterium]|nr:HAD family hydrolase [Candidatus Omnitrophota bacterium]MDD5435962.1 HAD family hydrolase [Candidatus Omnitrophota bacterium]